MGTSAEYDYYQVKLQVKLSDDVQCDYAKYGLSVFKIECVSDDQSGSDCGTFVPNASIVSIDLNRCDGLPAVFNLFLGLAWDDVRSVYRSGRFVISIGSVELITFRLNPLSVGAISSGEICESHFMEVTRVPQRVLASDSEYTIVDNTICGDELVVTVPLTHEIKCYVGNMNARQVLVVASGCNPLTFAASLSIVEDPEQKKCDAVLTINTTNAIVIDGPSPTIDYSFLQSFTYTTHLNVYGIGQCTERSLLNFRVVAIPYNDLVIHCCDRDVATKPANETSCPYAIGVWVKCHRYSYLYNMVQQPF